MYLCWPTEYPKGYHMTDFITCRTQTRCRILVHQVQSTTNGWWIPITFRDSTIQRRSFCYRGKNYSSEQSDFDSQTTNDGDGNGTKVYLCSCLSLPSREYLHWWLTQTIQNTNYTLDELVRHLQTSHIVFDHTKNFHECSVETTTEDGWKTSSICWRQTYQQTSHRIFT